MKAPSFVPPAAAAKAAARALAWRKKFHRGGTEIGVARARDIKNRRPLSLTTVLRMTYYFDRHKRDQKAMGFFEYQPGFPSPGRIAWDLWGGDDGLMWARNVARKEGFR